MDLEYRKLDDLVINICVRDWNCKYLGIWLVSEIFGRFGVGKIFFRKGIINFVLRIIYFNKCLWVILDFGGNIFYFGIYLFWFF